MPEHLIIGGSRDFWEKWLEEQKQTLPSGHTIWRHNRGNGGVEYTVKDPKTGEENYIVYNKGGDVTYHSRKASGRTSRVSVNLKNSEKKFAALHKELRHRLANE